jgi:hypothetical protein
MRVALARQWPYWDNIMLKPAERPARPGQAIAQAIAAVAALAAMGAPMLSKAEIYGWVDANGVVTYSNMQPPKDVTVTDVIHETPLSPQVIAAAAQRAEVSALNDRIRLLELEMARSQREVVDYPGPSPGAAGLGCGPDGYADCNPQWGPYYTTGFLHGGRSAHEFHFYGHGDRRIPGHGSNRPPAAHGRATHAASMHTTLRSAAPAVSHADSSHARSR